MSIENTDFRIEVLDVKNSSDVKLVHNFLSPMNIDYDAKAIDYTMILYNLNGDLLGTGSYQGEILKYIAVAPKFRGSPALANIVTHLSEIVMKNNPHIFVFTSPKASTRFEALGFTIIAAAELVFLLSLCSIVVSNRASNFNSSLNFESRQLCNDLKLYSAWSRL